MKFKDVYKRKTSKYARVKVNNGLGDHKTTLLWTLQRHQCLSKKLSTAVLLQHWNNPPCNLK